MLGSGPTITWSAARSSCQAEAQATRQGEGAASPEKALANAPVLSIRHQNRIQFRSTFRRPRDVAQLVILLKVTKCKMIPTGAMENRDRL